MGEFVFTPMRKLIGMESSPHRKFQIYLKWMMDGGGAFLRILGVPIISERPHRAACVAQLRRSNFRISVKTNAAFLFPVKPISNTDTVTSRRFFVTM